MKRVYIGLSLLLGAVATGTIIGLIAAQSGAPSSKAVSVPSLAFVPAAPETASAQPQPSAPPITPAKTPPAVVATGKTPDAGANTNGQVAVINGLETRQQLMSKLRDWAAKDPEAALAWVLKMPPGDERNDAMQALCYGLAQTDPAHALQMAQVLQQPASVMENLVQQWAGRDVAAALVWANNQPAGDSRDELMQRIAFVLSKTDPANAAGLVLEQIPPGPEQDEAVMTVLHQWANRDMVAAATWVQNFPPGPLRERALEELEGIENYQAALAKQ